jgi:hypothetical protein
VDTIDPLFILHPLLEERYFDRPSQSEIQALASYTGEAEEVCDVLFTLVLWERKQEIEEDFREKHGKTEEQTLLGSTGIFPIRCRG